MRPSVFLYGQLLSILNQPLGVYRLYFKFEEAIEKNKKTRRSVIHLAVFCEYILRYGLPAYELLEVKNEICNFKLKYLAILNEFLTSKQGGLNE